MDTMSTDLSNVVVKQEPLDQPTSPNSEENNNSMGGSSRGEGKIATGPGGDIKIGKDDKTPPGDPDAHTSSTNSSPLRYISRRGRPPGGGYSMKNAHSHYGISFGQSSVGMGSHDLLRQSTLGTSATSPHDLLKSGLDSGLDSLDARRFGLHCFEGEKNSFRCDGCDVVFGSRDTYAMHMLLRAKNESCVALPTSAISANPENPTPREKFERELREKAMINAIRNQAALMSKAAVAAAVIPRSSSVVDSAIQSLSVASARSPTSSAKEEFGSYGASSDLTAGLNSLFAFDSYGLYMDQRHYRRLLSEYSFKAASTSPSALSAMMEQLSCSVCGEVFTNKDALAMHMMFHTRDEESDTKPVVPPWKMNTPSSSSISKMMPLSVNTDSSAHHHRKQESSRSDGDRKLTVERIEELKRIAIESSLKSSLRKFPTKSSERNSRPKSASEDTVVTSSAQTRPLSADDAFKLSDPRDKGIYKPHKMIFKSSLQKESDSDGDDNHDDNDKKYRSEKAAVAQDARDAKETPSIPFRKRTLSISDDYLSNLPPFSKRQKHLYSDNDVHSIALRYDNFRSSMYTGRATKTDSSASFPKVCDNHVSSASGPQDSDETSNGSSSTVLEATRIEFGKTARDVESSSSLENIMSGDSILVPVENPEELRVNDDDCPFTEETRTGGGGGGGREGGEGGKRGGGVGAAIDFKVGKNGFGGMMTSAIDDDDDNDDDHDEVDDGDGDCISNTDNRSVGSASCHLFSDSRTFRQCKGNSDQGLSVPEEVDNINKQSSKRDTIHQHHVKLIPDGTPAAEVKDSSGRRSYDVSNESSRVGEARYCPHCEILFLDVTLFHLHMGLHNVNNPWQCNICGLACGGRLEFNTHVLHY